MFDTIPHMALKIKLTKIGRTDRRLFRIIVANEHSKRDGRSLKTLGFVDATKKPFITKINQNDLTDWIKKGAKPTVGVKTILGI